MASSLTCGSYSLPACCQLHLLTAWPAVSMASRACLPQQSQVKEELDDREPRESRNGDVCLTADEEEGEEEEGGPSEPELCYRPLQLGTLAGALPAFLHGEIQLEARCARMIHAVLCQLAPSVCAPHALLRTHEEDRSALQLGQALKQWWEGSRGVHSPLLALPTRGKFKFKCLSPCPAWAQVPPQADPHPFGGAGGGHRHPSWLCSCAAIAAGCLGGSAVLLHSQDSWVGVGQQLFAWLVWI